MPDDRSLRDVLFEYVVYVPIGIAASVAEQLPELTEKGRRLASTRLHMARLVGEFAVGHSQRRFGRVLSHENRPADSTTAEAGSHSGPPSRHGPESVAGTEAASPRLTREMTAPPADRVEEEVPAQPPSATTTGSGSRQRPPSPVPTSEAAVAEPRRATDAMPVVESLAIPAYDTLAASQVVQRLSSLEPDELEAVRRYELGTRGRRTILHRVAQLNAAGGRNAS